MGKIICYFVFILRLSLIATLSFITISCTTIEMVSIKNSTNEDIKFSTHFAYKSYEPYNVDVKLKPGENDIWDYEVNSSEKKLLDIGLKKIILSNDSGCTVVLERNKIEKIATKNGMWLINIDKNIMNCK